MPSKLTRKQAELQELTDSLLPGENPRSHTMPPRPTSVPSSSAIHFAPSAPPPRSSHTRLQKPPIISSHLSRPQVRISAPPAFSRYSDSARHSASSSFFERTNIVDPHNLGPDSGFKEDDDYLYLPSKDLDKRGVIFTMRGLSNLGCLLLLITALLALFIGYPLYSSFSKPVDASPSFGLGGTNASGQVPDMGNWGPIDNDTPVEFYTRQSFAGRGPMTLVFSDEFNTDGRTFYPGDDPYWEANDMHYWGTGNLEWYDPEAITTRNGALEITLSAKATHDLDYQGGMMSSWNKFCFTGGIIEAAVQLPGSNNVAGLWPAVWMMGNLGRAGYGATTEGLWPYSYDECDFGALPNQTLNGEPEAAIGDNLSWLPGQRLSRCTCDGESHPGPKHPDGTFVGRASPEIDLFEAQVDENGGHISQSAQWAPFNYEYHWPNTTSNYEINDPSISFLNPYVGGSLQQPTSVVSMTNQNCYDFGGTQCFAVYGVEYQPGFDDAYITWINDNEAAWTLFEGAMAPDPAVRISRRPFPQEPMYIIMNLGMSHGFGDVDLDDLVFPTTMRIDYIRVYQPQNAINIGCDPDDFPTASYINEHYEAYTNPNLTTWTDDFGQPWPRNSLIDDC